MMSCPLHRHCPPDRYRATTGDVSAERNQAMPSPSSRASPALEAPELAARLGRAGANSEGEALAARCSSAANAYLN
jgi:hypothetical protein